MLTAVEGLYKNGHVELLEMPSGVLESRIIVTFLGAKPRQSKPRLLKYGKYSGSKGTAEEDFKIAEWHGEPEFEN